MSNQIWQKLGDIPAGSLFETMDGCLAVKSEYFYSNSNPQCQCVLLDSGEYAHFDNGNDEAVKVLEIKLLLKWIKDMYSHIQNPPCGEVSEGFKIRIRQLAMVARKEE